MRPHVTDQSALDLAEGGGGDEDRAHLAACEACAARVEEVRRALSLARRAEVPEPSPLYWEALRHNVSRRIAEDKQRPSRWLLLLPVAAAAGLVAVLLAGRAAAPPALPEPVLSAWSALPPAEEDDALRVLEGLAAGEGELAAAWDLDLGLGPFLSALTDEESRALAETLHGAGQGGES